MKYTKYGFFAILFFIVLSFPLYSQAAQEDAIALRQKVVTEAKKYVGVPYAWGGTTTSGMDCSGFIYTTVRNSVGIQLPRTVEAMYGFMRIVPNEKKEVGDVLFFVTVGNSVSHAGIYIGNEQFIHSASDGPNTGVIVSSLKQTTWKNSYAGVGQFLPASLPVEDVPPVEKVEPTMPDGSTVPQHDLQDFLDDTTIDFSATMLWNFYSTDSFLFNIRGASLQAHIKYTGWVTQPGIGLELRFEPRMGIVQVPIHFTVSVPYGFRLYAGPVLTFGNPKLIGNSQRISSSVFPGILGFSWQSPSATIDKVGLSFVQDVAWTVFNKTDNSALPIGHSIVAGLVFSTGVRLTFGGSSFF